MNMSRQGSASPSISVPPRPTTPSR